jgi:hypothetical protein
MDTGEMVAHRLDTYQVLRRRPMNADERREYFQQKLWEPDSVAPTPAVAKAEQQEAETEQEAERERLHREAVATWRREPIINTSPASDFINEIDAEEEAQRAAGEEDGGTPFPTEYSQAEINRMADFYCGDGITREEPVKICYVLEQPHVIVEVTGVTDPTSVKACSILPIENVTEDGAAELRAKGDFYLGKKINCGTRKNPQWWVIVGQEQSFTVAPSADQDASQVDTFTAPRCDECKMTDGGHAPTCSQSDNLTYDDYFTYAQSQGKKNPASFARKMEVTLDPKIDAAVRELKRQSAAKAREATAGGTAA